MDAKGLAHSSLEKLARWAVYGLFFLIPIVFCSQTIDPFETNKQLVLVVLSSVALLGWLAHMVLGQQLRLRSGWVNLLPLAYLVAVIVSGVFSLAGFTTWLGGGMQEYTSVLTIATLVFLFYTLANLAGRLASMRGILCSVLLSATLSGLVTLLGMFGLMHLPFAFAQSNGFNTVGAINLFAVFELTVAFLGLTAWTIWPIDEDGRPLLGGQLGAVLRGCVVAVSVISVLLLIAIDFWVLWVLAIFGALLILSVGFFKGEEMPRPGRFILPFAILVLSGLFLVLPSPLRLGLPITVSPSYTSSWDMTRMTLSQGTQRLLTGSGPGTFAYDYQLFKPQSVNQTIFWNSSFDRAKSNLLTMLATTGIAATTLWILFLLVLGLQAAGRLAFERSVGDWKTTYVLFVPWSLLVLTHLLYSTNLTLTFLLWAFSGLLASQILTQERVASFGQVPRMALMTSFLFVLVGVATVGSLVLSAQRYAGELAFGAAIRKDREQAPVSDIIASMTAAVNANVILAYDTYARNLSAAYLASARELVAKADSPPTQDQVKAISQAVAASVDAGRAAVQAGPANVANWVVLGSIYRDVMPFASGAEDFAAATFQKAIELEPVNPIHYTDLARIHLAVAERARQLKGAEDKDLAAKATEAEKTELTAAEDALNKAIQLKPDYAPAHYYLAAVYERQGKLQEAADRLTALTRYSPNDIGLGFQLAMLDIRLENLDAARAELERIVGLNPDYSNALWYLSAVEEVQGDDVQALQNAQHVLELNPTNEAAKARVNALQSGNSTPQELPSPVEEGEGDVVGE